MQNASVAFHAKGWVLWVQKAGGKGAIIVGEGKAKCFVAPFGFGASLPNCLLIKLSLFRVLPQHRWARLGLFAYPSRHSLYNNYLRNVSAFIYHKTNVTTA